MLNYILFAGKLLLCALIDIGALAAFYGPTLFFSRCFFYGVLITRGSFRLVCAAAFFALLPTLIVADSFGADLVVMIPLGFGAYYLSRIADLTLIFRALAVCVCLVIHTYLIDTCWIGLSSHLPLLFLHFVIALFMVY